MEGSDQAAAYAAADFGEPNERQCQELLARFDLPPGSRIVDLGCGPADIPLRLLAARPDLRIDAVDGAAAMLAHATAAIERAGCAERIALHEARLPGVPLTDQAYEAVISSSLLHHLHEPALLWREVRRLGRSGAAVCVMDLFRPTDEAGVRSLVELHAAGMPAVLRQDFEASLRAAFRPDEVREQLAQASLDSFRVELLSDRHLMVTGRLP